MSISDKIVVRSEPKQVYRAMLHPESLSKWWGCTAVIDAQPGGAWVGGWGEGTDGLGQQTVIWAQLAELTPDALVVLPGGPGTRSELELALRYGRPVVVYARRGDAIGGLTVHGERLGVCGREVPVALDPVALAAFLDAQRA